MEGGLLVAKQPILPRGAYQLSGKNIECLIATIDKKFWLKKFPDLPVFFNWSYIKIYKPASPLN